jgi:hypothetical protein
MAASTLRPYREAKSRRANREPRPLSPTIQTIVVVPSAPGSNWWS